MERSEDNLCSNTTNMSSLSKHADGVHKVGGTDKSAGRAGRGDTVVAGAEGHGAGHAGEGGPDRTAGEQTKGEYLGSR